jgi:hypothetical protein
MSRRNVALFNPGDRVLYNNKVVTVIGKFAYQGKDVNGKPSAHLRYVVRDLDCNDTEVAQRWLAPYFPADNPFGDGLGDYERWQQQRWVETMADFDRMEVN